MSQHDGVLDNAPGQAFRLDVQAAIQALFTQSGGTTEPSTMYPGQPWLDTSGGGNGVLKARNQANSAWLTFAELLGGVDSLLVRGTALASASTVTLANATGYFVHITGTTTITSFGADAAGTLRFLTFDGSLQITHNGTSMILPGGANIQTAAGDSAIFVSEGSSNWRCVSYQRAEVSTKYTPTITNGSNVAASTAYACRYYRTGNTVWVSGQVSIDPTAASGTTTDIGISLPIASALTADHQLSGTASNRLNGPGSIYADPTNDRAILEFLANNAANAAWTFVFSYEVL